MEFLKNLPLFRISSPELEVLPGVLERLNEPLVGLSWFHAVYSASLTSCFALHVAPEPP